MSTRGPLPRTVAEGYQPRLSERDQRTLSAIARYWIDHGYGPTTNEMKRTAGHVTSSTVHYAFFKLRELDLVAFTDGCSRTIRPTSRGWMVLNLNQPCCKTP